MELALKPGVFIADDGSFSFVSDLDTVAARIAGLVATEPARATALYETFYAGCQEKAEELDDSSGSFGQFADGLLCGWIKARQASGADADETAARLLARMDNDPYAFCHRLEGELANAFDKAGLAAFVNQVRARFDAAAKAAPMPEQPFREQPEYTRRHWGEVLRALYLAQQNLTAYRALTEETGLTADDCLALATLWVARRKLGEALTWAERGIELQQTATQGSIAGYNLAKLKRDLLTKLGRGDEALEAAWTDYLQRPDNYTYADLMKFVPKANRAAWHEKAIEAAKDSSISSLIELLLATKELARLADLVVRSPDAELEKVSHSITQPAARKLEKTHPGLAARLWRAQGMRIVNAKKSKYYEAALGNFEEAKRCYERAGRTADWIETVNQIRTLHHRKVGFIAGFEDLVAGGGPSAKPSFLERAKARWS